LVKHARVIDDGLIVDQLRQLAHIVRRAREVIVIRRDNVVELLQSTGAE